MATIIATMTTPATSLCAALRQGAEAYGIDLLGSTSALAASGSGHVVAFGAGSAAQHAFGAERIGKRRPHPSRFVPLSSAGQVS